jgi:putative nucleotidyltransferase with HDIG domain
MEFEQPGDRSERHGPGAMDVPIPFHAVTALISALHYRDPDTAEHSRRVADLCVACAAGLMNERERYILEVGALLHDIGKLGVPDAVLLKPGPLTPEERKIIETHDWIGVQILATAFTSDELTAIVRSHHAWYDGNRRQPDLPIGEEIPLGARILSIADAYDAIVSDRVYRKGRTREEAFAELRRWAGKQFDPGLVERFIEIVGERDDTRRLPGANVPKQTALRIGLQMEKIVCALDTQDVASLGTMAQHLKSTADDSGVGPLAEMAAQLAEMATEEQDPDWLELVQLTTELLELCRATQRAYFSGDANRRVVAEEPDEPEGSVPPAEPAAV